MSQESTKEPQYNHALDVRDEVGLTQIGIMSNQVWYDDPRRIVFVLSRYKFVSKMFAGLEHVLEVGCADALGTRLVQQTVKKVTAVDFDPIFIEDVKARMTPKWTFDARIHDMLDGPLDAGPFDGAYALDVLEHIQSQDEDRFLRNMIHTLKEHGVMIIGMPSLASQAYASEGSKAGHVNCKNGDELKATMEKYFHNVFIFSMNDEVLHTGFWGMSHYVFALCVGKR